VSHWHPAPLLLGGNNYRKAIAFSLIHFGKESPKNLTNPLMVAWLSLRIKSCHYFTLCSNEFVLFLVALG
jgi:hypothetical protein